MLLRRVVGSAGSVAAVAAGRDNVCECFEIEFDDGLERLGGRSAGEGFGQGLVPSGVFGLQGEQFGDGIIPSLGSGTFISGSAIPDKWRGLIGLQPSAVTGLSLGIAEGVLALGLASSGMTLLRHVTELSWLDAATLGGRPRRRGGGSMAPAWV